MPDSRLSYDELLVLRLVQARFGPQNTLAGVFVTGAADACVAVRDRSGVERGVVNLTRLGAWYRSGEMTLDALRAWIAGESAA